MTFLATMAFVATALLGLGWMVLERDETDRLAARREATADRAVLTLERGLTTVEQQIAALLVDPEQGEHVGLAEGAVLVELHDGRARAWPSGRLAYSPGRSVDPFVPDATLSQADDLEFVERRHDAAIALLQAHASSSGPDVRAHAFARLARNLVKSGRASEALDVYAELAALETPLVAGMPAALAARSGELWVFETQGDQEALARTARKLDSELRSGRWSVSAATYAALSEQAARWLDRTADASHAGAPRGDERLALARAVEVLASERSGPEAGASGRRSISTAEGPVLLAWNSSGGRTVAFAATAGYLDTAWLEPAGLDVRLTDTVGLVVRHAAAADTSRAAYRSSVATTLPWTIEVFDDPEAPPSPGDRSRQLLLVSSLCAVLVVIAAGAWFVSRSVTRELEMARLQADFVQAVSHEFRTPLTTLCQLSELLERGRVASEDDRRIYYGFLGRESERLRRLVEGVLSFGRLESGSLELRPEVLEAATLVRESVAEFEAAKPASGHRIEVRVDGDVPSVRVDREAFRLALWNLLDNAVKYSPGREVVHVDVTSLNGSARIAVRDGGFGIAPEEQARVFGKFARGQAARAHAIAGTGIGLATSREIVRALGGEISVDSALGAGSTFTIALPPAEAEVS